jgi:hypothetical protein
LDGTKTLPNDFVLPKECEQYKHIVGKLQRKLSNAKPPSPVAFAGMPGNAVNPNEIRRAQIKRRLTTRSKERESSWF